MIGGLEALAKALSEGDQHESNIPAGYTYLGQMISHDLVRPTRTNFASRTFSAKLELESIFGAAFNGFPEPDGNRRWDLPRNPDGRACIPEPRNDENVIIAQLHRLWQLVHEAIVRNGADPSEARKDVVLLFQAVVIDDYLKRILQPHIFSGVLQRGERHLGFSDNAIPDVFSQAAFRFGHSMVRRSYSLNAVEQGVSLPSLFLANSQIPDRFKISWSEFFETDPGRPPQRAMGIDTTIASFMNAVPDNSRIPQDVILKNLEAGSTLPKGAEYVSGLLHGLARGEERYPKIAPELHLYRAANASVQVLGVPGDQLPMFPYLLLEGELHGQRNRLGVLGSLIVGETIQNAIRTASPSVFEGGVYRFDLVWKRLSSTCRNVILASRQNRYRGAPQTIDMVTIISLANLT